MDRDVVLEARAAGADAGRALLDRDDGDWVVLASFRPDFPDPADGGVPRCLKIVVDCSGSMSGDSIEQVRIAGERILDSLRPGDLFDIVAFGTGHRALFGRAMPASPGNVDRAREFVRDLDADLGGTEIESALRAAYGIEGEPGLPRDLLLITDGEVWDTDAAVAEARASGHRIFTVGVGSAVAEPFVRSLAGATGGACELVAPREDMAERIHRHFQRILAPPARRARVIWPAPVRHPVPDPLPPPYPGDTLHLFGSFSQRPAGPLVLELELADGRTISQRLEIGPLPPPNAGVEEARATRSELARMGAARRLPAIDDEAAATELAVRYQLVSEWTDCLVVHVRAEAEKADDLPSLVKVPQVLAAGWHGIGTVHDASAMRRAKMRCTARRHKKALPQSPLREMIPPGSGIHARLDRIADRHRHRAERALAAGPCRRSATLRHSACRTRSSTPFGELVEQGEDARAVAVIFLYLICESPAGSGLDRRRRRLILSAYKKLAPGTATIGAVRRVWQGWDPPDGGAMAGP